MASVTKRPWTSPSGEKKEGWQVRYFDPATGKRPGKLFKLKKDAEAFRRKVEREIEDGQHVAASETATVNRACDEYMAQALQRMRDGRIGRSRYEGLRHSVEKKIAPQLGSKILRDLREAEVEAFYDAMMAGGTLQPTSARTQLGNLKLIEDFAIKRGYLRTTPVANVLKDLKGFNRTRIKTFDTDTVKQVLAAADTRPRNKHIRPWEMIRVMANVAAYCGLRRGEIAALSLAHVHPDRRLIEVRQALTEYRTLKGPKTKSGIRDVPMPERVAAMLRSWIATHYVPNEHELLFATNWGDPLQLNTTQYLWEELLKHAGLYDGGKRFHFHALRHFYASMMISTGTPLPDAAALLGHSTFDMTLQVYTHAVTKPAIRHDFVERMAACLEDA